MATKRTVNIDGEVVTFHTNRTYNLNGIVVSEQLLGSGAVPVIAQAKSTNRFVFSRVHGRVN